MAFVTYFTVGKVVGKQDGHRHSLKKLTKAQNAVLPKDGSLSSGSFISLKECLSVSSDTLRASNEFRSVMHNLLDEWYDLVEWLSYRYMVAYWLGLVRYRQGSYCSRDANHLTPLLPSKHSHDKIGLFTRLTEWKLLPIYDWNFFQLQCMLFRDAQRSRREEYLERLRRLEREYCGIIGAVRVKFVRESVFWARGRFVMSDEFDREMDIQPEHIEAERRFGGTQ